MLEGIRCNEIIVGGYTDRAGGVCPVLAAHRCGGRTSFISFARAWDRFAGTRHARRATVRERRQVEAGMRAGEPARPRHGDRRARGAARPGRRARGVGAATAATDSRPARPRCTVRERWASLRPGRRATEDQRALARLEAELDVPRAGEPVAQARASR